MRHLLTPSLHDNWLWYGRMDSKEKADFLNTLLKIQPTDPDQLERMEAGKIFEAHIRNYTLGKFTVNEADPYSRCVREIGDIVEGGLWQQRVMFDLRFFGMDFLVYGKIDVRRRDFIFDIKKTAKYEMGKYTESVQHGTYMIGERCKKFAYLASDGDDVYREDYAMDSDTEKSVFAAYEEMVDGIMADPDFRRAYQENWKAFGEREGSALNDPGRFLNAG